MPTTRRSQTTTAAKSRNTKRATKKEEIEEEEEAEDYIDEEAGESTEEGSGQPEEDLYALLGVDKKATADDIRKAYYRQALRYHPDRNKDDEQANAKFQQLGGAYEILSDADKRAVYDQTGSVVDDAFLKSDVNWTDYFSRVFKPVTEDDIVSFQKTYPNSKEEEEDLRNAYNRHKGKLQPIFDAVPLAEPSEYERYVKKLQELINTGILTRYPAFQQDLKNLAAIRAKAEKLAAKEAKEFEQSNKSKAESTEDLTKAILARRKQGKQDVDDLVSRLEQKYGGKTKGAKRKESEPSEEEFEAARARVAAKKKGGK